MATAANSLPPAFSPKYLIASTVFMIADDTENWTLVNRRLY